jgi:hypothetical protein
MTWTRAVFFVNKSSDHLIHIHAGIIMLTHGRGLLSVEVTGLVTLEETSGLRCRSSTTGETGVEVDYTFHTCSILSSTNCLKHRQ